MRNFTTSIYVTSLITPFQKQLYLTHKIGHISDERLKIILSLHLFWAIFDNNVERTTDIVILTDDMILFELETRINNNKISKIIEAEFKYLHIDCLSKVIQKYFVKNNDLQNLYEKK